ncbi:DNA-directed RNA polymerase III subunit 2, partial [Cucurbita argyrosperma subsp. argyrosperma]
MESLKLRSHGREAVGWRFKHDKICRNGKQVDDPNAIDLDIDKKFLGLPIKSAVDKFQLIPAFFKPMIINAHSLIIWFQVRGLVRQRLRFLNYFVNTEIKKIVKANDRIESSNDRTYLRYFATGMRMLRRAGKIGEFINVFVNEKQ